MDAQRDVSRGGEKALGIIGIVFNILGIALLVFTILSLGNVENNPEFRQMLEEQIMSDPTMAEVGDVQGIIDGLLTSFDVIAWVMIGSLVLSTIFALLAVAKLGRNRNPKLAGIFFIVGGLFAGILSLTSILFYIAALMCFIRKARNNDGRVRDEDTLRYENDRLRDDNQSLHREEQRLREKEEQLREKEAQLEKERHLRQTEQSLAEEDLVQREDLKRRAEERLRKDSDDTPRRPL